MEYPKHILLPETELTTSTSFRYTLPTAFLLSLVSGVNFDLIKNCKVYSRSLLRFRPWYSAKKGGGAITLGNRKNQNICFTENFFSADKKLFPHSAYANKTSTWLRMSAHEVGHLAHTERYGSLVFYLIVFIYQYLVHGHDDAPLEQEANMGSNTFNQFQSYLSQQYGSHVLEKLLLSLDSDEVKVETIKSLWSEFKEVTIK